MLKLCERQRVKDFCNLARADTLWDSVLDGMIEQASADVETLCRRSFLYQERIEYFTSYEQAAFGESQYLFPEAFPIDTSPEKFPMIKYSPNNDHFANGLRLSPGGNSPDFQITSSDPTFVDTGAVIGPSNRGTQDVIVIRGANNQTSPYPYGWSRLQYADRGWEIIYWGGYDYLSTPPDEPYDPDPMDDFNVIGVPVALRTLVARKIANDFLAPILPAGQTPTRAPRSALIAPTALLRPWTDQEKLTLRPYRRRNLLGG